MRYIVGGPSVVSAEDLARQDDDIARKSDGVKLSADMVQKANQDLVNVLRDSGCSEVPEIMRVPSLGAGISAENILVYMECLKEGWSLSVLLRSRAFEKTAGCIVGLLKGVC